MEKINLPELMASGVDLLSISISKQEVETKDFTYPLSILQELVTKEEYIKHFKENIDISFHGYDDTRDELWEISEVRDYIKELDRQFPYWLFFLSKETGGLFAIIKSFLTPFLKPEVDKQINGEKLKDYLEKRGFPAMNHLCEAIGMTEEENAEMTNRLVEYLETKPIFA